MLEYLSEIMDDNHDFGGAVNGADAVLLCKTERISLIGRQQKMIGLGQAMHK